MDFNLPSKLVFVSVLGLILIVVPTLNPALRIVNEAYTLFNFLYDYYPLHGLSVLVLGSFVIYEFFALKQEFNEHINPHPIEIEPLELKNKAYEVVITHQQKQIQTLREERNTLIKPYEVVITHQQKQIQTLRGERDMLIKLLTEDRG